MKDKILNILIGVLLIGVIGIGIYAFVFNKQENTSVKLSKNTVKIQINETIKLDTVLENINVSDLLWKSDNENIASVSSDGLVKGNNSGTTVITVYTKDNKISDRCSITVIKKNIEKLELDKNSVELEIGKTIKLNVTIIPSELKNEKLTWVSNNINVATVSDGLIKGVSKGETTIKVVSGNVMSECVVKVLGPTPSPTSTVKPTPSPTSTPKPSPSPVPQYTVKYYDVSVIETDLSKATLNGNESVPVVQSKLLNLVANTSYVVSFDYKTVGGTNKFNVDLYPDDLPEKILNATTSNTHYDWEVSSNSGNMNSCRLRFFDNQQESNEKDIIISNITLGTIKKETRKRGDTIGTMPTPIRSGYTFLGWYTASTGGTQVSSNTKVSGNITLYPHWEEKVRVLPTEYTVPNGYSAITGSSYISDTLKYKTIKHNTSNKYYSLIWVKDANKQMNTANNDLKGGQRQALLNGEITNLNLKTKGMIATNGSFSWNSRANIPVIAVKGSLITNDKYVPKLSDGRSLLYATLTIGRDNSLVYKTTSDATESRNWLTSIGARNTWSITHYETSDWSGGRDGGADTRTSICQVDKNNFVLYTGYSLGIHDYMKELHDMFGCNVVVNLDGGGSSGMYYKTKSMERVGVVYEYKRPKECCRSIGDMLYFTE